jgi:hypothetical protein
MALKVRAKKGRTCPRHQSGLEPITDSRTVSVPDSAFYRGLVRDGSLVVQQSQSKSKTSNQ